MIALTILKYTLSASERVIFTFAFDLSRILHYTNPVLGFYLFTLSGAKFRVEMKRCAQYGLIFSLRKLGLTRYLPLLAERAIVNWNQIGVINTQFTTRQRQGNTGDTNRQQT
ncbi:hypothetical protein I4U23_011267 [Adineta vaga]|nr:hypothetical protein I4U23_011267 [Adineta vaga]